MKRQLIVVDRQLTILRASLEDFSLSDAQATASRCRMILSEVLQKVDKLVIGVLHEQRLSIVGFSPTENLGKVRDVSKSVSPMDSLIQSVLRGDYGVKDIAKATKPKARNE